MESKMSASQLLCDKILSIRQEQERVIKRVKELEDKRVQHVDLDDVLRSIDNHKSDIADTIIGVESRITHHIEERSLELDDKIKELDKKVQSTFEEVECYITQFRLDTTPRPSLESSKLDELNQKLDKAYERIEQLEKQFEPFKGISFEPAPQPVQRVRSAASYVNLPAKKSMK